MRLLPKAVYWTEVASLAEEHRDCPAQTLWTPFHTKSVQYEPCENLKLMPGEHIEIFDGADWRRCIVKCVHGHATVETVDVGCQNCYKAFSQDQSEFAIGSICAEAIDISEYFWAEPEEAEDPKVMKRQSVQAKLKRRLDYMEQLQLHVKQNPLPKNMAYATIGDLLPTDGNSATAVLKARGAVVLPAGTIPNDFCSQVDRWVMALQPGSRPDFFVKNSYHREHMLVTLEDGPESGAVRQAVAAVLRGLDGALPDHAWLLELAVFRVSAGAESQKAHPDYPETANATLGRTLSTVSCQLYLHDTPAASGALAVWPNSVGINAQQALTLNVLDVEERLAEFQGVEIAPLGAGAVACYNSETLHRGTRHLGGDTRRVLYFTAVFDEVDVPEPPVPLVHALHDDLRNHPRQLRELLQ
eukprot:gnl/MRDRNA2_/MRDRNA2_51941_c0_seq2.p1 gnl/MRDRNA2_/MRDRNA2_51941_c0~~gnl/MRDRNA2_/MRDRNA2_51941_c0_seq2.p1  ORF type:complete len:464 (+),score=102.80 gnl/MRDRNA2_/MRDRNA2_51941_c0_seq2:151-1392(+)